MIGISKGHPERLDTDALDLIHWRLSNNFAHLLFHKSNGCRQTATVVFRLRSE